MLAFEIKNGQLESVDYENPQGSILETLLFQICINDINYHLRFEN